MTSTENEPAESADTDAETEASHSAPYDPIIAERLGAPATPDAIYLEETSHYRPISTGDIFRGVVVPGSEEEAEHDLTMLVAHPSAMRSGAELHKRARAAPVAPINDLSRRKWSKGHFNVFPLPLLCKFAKENGFEIDDRGWGALLELAAPIQTAQLDVRKRVACLSPVGVELLLQKLVHADTRYPVKEDLIRRAFATKLEEIELLQTWNEELVTPKINAAGTNLDAELAAAASEFEAVLDHTDELRTVSLREMLRDDTRAGEARRLLAQERRARSQAS